MTDLRPEDTQNYHQMSPEQAISYQRTWSGLIKEEEPMATIETVAGVDVGYDPITNRAFAVAVVIDALSLQVIEIQRSITPVQFPYIPGFLSFREVPAIKEAFDKLTVKPDLLVCDGQGIAHPRRFGIACHLGVIYNIPTIGCGKSRLYGWYSEPGNNKGDYTYLYDNKKNIIGCVMRTRANYKPVYISIGNRMTLAAAREWVLKLSPKYRLPETTRLADRLADEHKLQNK